MRAYSTTDAGPVQAFREDALGTDDGVEIARRIAEDEVDRSEVLEAAIARAESVHPQLNAIAQAAKMRAAGDPVIHLGGGEPKSNAPQAAIEAGKAMLDRN